MKNNNKANVIKRKRNWKRPLIGFTTLTLLVGSLTGMYYWGIHNADESKTNFRGTMIKLHAENLEVAAEELSEYTNENYSGASLELTVNNDPNTNVNTLVTSGVQDFVYTSHYSWYDYVEREIVTLDKDNNLVDFDLDKKTLEFFAMSTWDAFTWDKPDGEDYLTPVKGSNWDELVSGDILDLSNSMEDPTLIGGEAGEVETDPDATKTGFYRSQLFVNEFGTDVWYEEGLTETQYKELGRPLNERMRNDWSIVSQGRSFLENDYSDQSKVESAITNGDGGDVLFAYLDGFFKDAMDKASGTKVDIQKLFDIQELRHGDVSHFGLTSNAKRISESKFLGAYSSIGSFSNYVGIMPIYENIFQWDDFATSNGFDNAQEAIIDTLYSGAFARRDDTEYFTGPNTAISAHRGTVPWVKMMKGNSLLVGQTAGFRQHANNHFEFADPRGIDDEQYFKDAYKNTIGISTGAITWNPGFAIHSNSSHAKRAMLEDIFKFIVEDQGASDILFGKLFNMRNIEFLDDSYFTDMMKDKWVPELPEEVKYCLKKIEIEKKE